MQQHQESLFSIEVDTLMKPINDFMNEDSSLPKKRKEKDPNCGLRVPFLEFLGNKFTLFGASFLLTFPPSIICFRPRYAD